MRFVLVQAVLAVSGLAIAQEPCLDTLLLNSIQVERQTLRNSATLGGWSSVVLKTFDANSLRAAAPLAQPPVSDLPEEIALTDVRHFTRIVSNACSDMVSPVEFWRVTDTFKLSGVAAIEPAVRETDSILVTRRSDEAVLESGKPQELKYRWTSDDFDLALVDAADTVDAWSIWFVGRSFRNTNVGVPVSGVRAYRMFQSKVTGYLAEALALFQASVDSVGRGELDSTRFDIVRMRHVYQRPVWVGVKGKRLAPRLQAVREGDGWRFSLSGASSLSISGLDGRVVRRLSGARDVFWDGHDQEGRRVPAGIWLVGGVGAGSSTIFVR
ncbi:MAG TPA: hypothetical protein PK208_13050 [Fibrobacteria bacterium]|nr:hypothetical protein [Fibrobacteria bacterium]